MAKIIRKTLTQFGTSGATSNFGQFGSKEAGLPQTSKDPTIIQQLSAWSSGWQSAVPTGDKAAYLEDMNGWCLVHSYMTAYMLQAGIPEWDAGTTYFIGSVVQDAASNSRWYVSLQDNNVGNALPGATSNAFWRWVNPGVAVISTATVNKVPKITAVANSGPQGSYSVGDSSITDDGTNVKVGLPLKFPDNTVQSTASTGPVSARTTFVPGGARALNTTYTNSGSKPMLVSVTIRDNSSLVTAYVGVGSPTTVVGRAGWAGGATDDVREFMMNFWVFPGESYKLTTAGSSAFFYWVEYT